MVTRYCRIKMITSELELCSECSVGGRGLDVDVLSACPVFHVMRMNGV